MITKQTLSSKLALTALVILLIFLGDIELRQWRDQRAIEKQKQSLEQQVALVQKKNDDLNQSLQYLSSASFKEKVAREQLSLKKNEEQVYSFTTGPALTNNDSGAKVTNAKKWWDYFFTN